MIRISLTGGDPELDARSCAGFAVDSAPSTGELSAFLHRQQAEVAWHVHALGDHETCAVVGHLDADTTIDGRSCHTDARGMRVLLNVRQRFRNVLEDE